jgi:DNA-binding NtrC family response regulator
MTQNIFFEQKTNPITDNQTRILIAVEPGFLRDSIRTILSTYHFVVLVSQKIDDPDCWNEIRLFQPHVFLVDCSPTHLRLIKFLQQIRERHPGSACLAITNTTCSSSLALEHGAGETLANGFTSHELQQAIRRVFLQAHQEPK